jgi:hypothetical protein
MRDDNTVGQATISLPTAMDRRLGHDLFSITLGGWDAHRVTGADDTGPFDSRQMPLTCLR